jgi:ParB family transcriptional regulator, chromosome partitioning protein
VTIQQMIPLNRLVPSKDNVRKTGGTAGIDELAASIKAHGLLQNLQVRAGVGDKFEVVAGRRRLAALKRLAKDKAIAKDADIPCQVCHGENAAEISLAENIVRLPMHPADQFEAFKTLAEDGKGPEEIAARFGCSPATVRQRLRLACVSPALLDAYRADDMTLDQLMAFTVSDDHGAQQTTWADLPAWNRHPDTIRRILTQAHVEAADRRARFVGIEAYTAAGGNVLRDLFTPEHEGYLIDPALLDRLAAERLQREAAAIRAEGWKWVEIMPELDYPGLRQYRRVYPEIIPPDEATQAEIDRLTAAYDALVAAHGDDPSDAAAAEIETISDQIDALSQGTERWAPEDLARAGAVIGIGHAGGLAIERGLVRPEDMPQMASQTISRQDNDGRSKATKSSGGAGGQLPAALIETLTAQRTAALRAMLAGNPDTALAAIVHAAALPVFYRPFAVESCLALRLDSADLSVGAEGIADSRAMISLAERHGLWRQRLPETAEGLWDWLLARDTATRLDLLAYCAALSVDAVDRAHEHVRDGRLHHADRLAAALGLDMAEWWQPTAESYLGRVSKARILAAVAEGVTPQAAENLAKLKKDTLIALAEDRLAGRNWLPAPLRAPVMTQVEPPPAALAAE